MRKPRPDEKIVCPAEKEQLEPEQVWDSEIYRPILESQTHDKSKVAKQKVTYGVFKKHHHRGEECDYSGHVVPVVQISAGPEIWQNVLNAASQVKSGEFDITEQLNALFDVDDLIWLAMF